MRSYDQNDVRPNAHLPRAQARVEICRGSIFGATLMQASESSSRTRFTSNVAASFLESVGQGWAPSLLGGAY